MGSSSSSSSEDDSPRGDSSGGTSSNKGLKISANIVKITNEKELLEEIYFCEERCKSALGIFYHAFLVIKAGKEYYKCEIGGTVNNVQLVIKKHQDKKITNISFQAQDVIEGKTIQDLVDFSKKEWVNEKYHVLNNNCYDYSYSILKEFTENSNNLKKVRSQEKKSKEAAAMHVGGVYAGLSAGVLAGAPIGPVGILVGGLYGALAGGLSAVLSVEEARRR